MKTLKNISAFFAKSLLMIGLLSINAFTFAQTDISNIVVTEKYPVAYSNLTETGFINDSALYIEGWHNLPQTIFWEQVMNLPPDSAIINVAANRQVLGYISVKYWNKLSEKKQDLFKDSLKKTYNIPDDLTILVTVGKKDFYEFEKAIPIITRSIKVFNQNCVDPWYAQAILLIECPGKMNTKSKVGANGPFQLMKAVARNQGLIVNNIVDERTNIEKSALGASRLLSRICIPKVRAMLDSAHLQYSETDLWFRLLVLHAYHAGAGNVAGIIRKINPCEGGMPLLQTVWKTTYGGFKNSSQNYSQLALAAFCNFNKMVTEQGNLVYLIDGDQMLNTYTN